MLFTEMKKFMGLFPEKTIGFIIVLFCSTLLLPVTAESETVTPYQSIEQALQHSPQIQALTHNQRAAEFDLLQSRDRYLPSLDLELGYGLDQHSDDVTRRANADPNDDDWDSRGNATLKLTQNVYTGGEISQQILIRQALLESAQFQIMSAVQTVTLDAIAAHLEVFRQRELVALAEKNFSVHHEIYKSLKEREQAGSGDIANVSQVQARLARAQSNLYLSKSELAKALVTYQRVVGIYPEAKNVTYVESPENLPPTLENALVRMEKQNPELLALTSTLTEADARVDLARSTYKPKIDLQLSSRYKDQVEGDQSWQNTNEAIVNLRWNLFNGGQDRAGENAALSRKEQSRSVWKNKVLELRETTSAAWETYKSLHEQKGAYRDAVKYSRKTFDAYLTQFSVSQRSLLDILNAENDYFQSATQLITVTVNETLMAYRILALSGDLGGLKFTGVREYPEDFKWLKQSPTLSSETTTFPAPVPSIESLPEEKIQQLLDQWSNNWREQDVAGYLGCYSRNFVPEGGRSKQEWQSSRSKELTIPAFISLTINNLRINEQSDSIYQVEFDQTYRSDSHSDQVSKKMRVEIQNEGWKIAREQVIPYNSESLTTYFSEEKETSIKSKVILTPSHVVAIGPCIKEQEVRQAAEILSKLDLKFDKRIGTGKVKVTRLYEGSYPADKALTKLAIVKEKFQSAYVLPEENKQLGLYLGAFHDAWRAKIFAETLQSMGIQTTPTAAEVEMTGEILISQHTDNETGQLLLGYIKEIGLIATVTKIE